MSNGSQPIPYRQWYQSDRGEELRWIFRSCSSLGYFLRRNKVNLFDDGLIQVIPTRGYYINSDKFNTESVKRYFFIGK